MHEQRSILLTEAAKHADEVAAILADAASQFDSLAGAMASVRERLEAIARDPTASNDPISMSAAQVAEGLATMRAALEKLDPRPLLAPLSQMAALLQGN